MVVHQYGGDWTTDKLERVRQYLAAYATIFARNPRARKLATTYVDAFAGTGYRSPRPSAPSETPSFAELAEPEAEAFLKGSARVALEVSPPFKQYVFIEHNAERVRELHRLKQQFPGRAKAVEIVQREANGYLKEWCAQTDWRVCRAVVFLDPYGMEVEWATIEAIARTLAVDLWILFPLGVAVNRLLTRDQPPPTGWARALTRILGTEDWQSAFYRQHVDETLFGPKDVFTKEADYGKIGRFFVERLKTVFTRVADNPLPLRNSTNVPLYLLCFAAGNPRGAPTAIKIAQYILGR